MTIVESTPAVPVAAPGSAPERVTGYADLFAQDRSLPHWAFDYAGRLARRHPVDHRILIQTSMSPSGAFHIGNLRDTICAHLVHRALTAMGRRSGILLSFDDYDPFRPGQAASDPALNDFVGRPLAAARERATRICRAYISELKQLGICPADADPDGRTPPGSIWDTHYQWERYTAETYRDLQRDMVKGRNKLAKLLGVSRPDRLFSVYCEQCGRNDTEILHLRPDRVRYRCHACTAILTTTRVGPVKPSWALDWTLRVAHENIDCEPAGQDHCSAGSTMDRTRPLYQRHLRIHQPVIVPYGLVREPGQRRKISGSGGGGMVAGDLLAVMPATMILWLYSRQNCLSDIRVSMRRDWFLSAYAEYDRFRERAALGGRALTLHRLISDTPPVGPLPGMRRVMGLLHSYCYDVDRVVERLAETTTDASAIRDRVDHAMAWIASHGRPTSWLFADAPDDLPLFDGDDLDGRWDRQRHQRLHSSLFGVRSGPPLRVLLKLFGEKSLLTAVVEHRTTGRRPLRELLLARLNGDAGEG